MDAPELCGLRLVVGLEIVVLILLAYISGRFLEVRFWKLPATGSVEPTTVTSLNVTR